MYYIAQEPMYYIAHKPMYCIAQEPMYFIAQEFGISLPNFLWQTTEMPAARNKAVVICPALEMISGFDIYAIRPKVLKLWSLRK